MKRVAVVAATLLLVSCASSTGRVGDEALGGPGLPVQLDDETYPGEHVRFDGSLVVRGDGCFYVRMPSGTELFAIWPQSASAEGGTVRTASGDLEDGAALLGTGRVTAVSHLAANPYWEEAHLGFCAPDESDVLVLDEVSPTP